MNACLSHFCFPKSFVLALVGLILSICSCDSPSLHSRAVATINSQSISVTDLAVRLLQTPGLREASPETKLKSALVILDSLLDDKTLFIVARQQKITVSDAAIEHQMRKFRRGNMIDDERLRELHREQLTVAEFLVRLKQNGTAICESELNVQTSQICIKRQDYLLGLRKKFRIVINETNIPLALKALEENA